MGKAFCDIFMNHMDDQEFEYHSLINTIGM